MKWNAREFNAAADQLARGAPARGGPPAEDDTVVHHLLQASLAPAVKAAIAALNANAAPGFKDFAGLRTGGSDAFSRITLAAQQHVEGDVLNQITQAVADPKAQAVALRWVLRGLGVKRAIRKVAVDAEIAERSRR